MTSNDPFSIERQLASLRSERDQYAREVDDLTNRVRDLEDDLEEERRKTKRLQNDLDDREAELRRHTGRAYY